MKGAPKLQIGTLDVYKTLIVAGFLAFGTFLSIIAQAISGADFANVIFLGVNGEVIALAVANVLTFLATRLLKNTR